MASPQVEDGYTKIANEILEALARTRFAGQERQILDVILRKTYGFQKSCDHISMGQFSELTGIKRPKVALLLKSLISKNIISVIQKDNSVVNCYIFQKDWEKWEVLPKKITVPQKDNELFPKMVTKVFPKKIHTKERKKIQKKDSDVESPLWEEFWSLYPPRDGKKLGKGETLALFERLSPDEQVLVVKAVKNYAASGRMPVDPQRFFKSREYKNGLWREYLDGEQSTIAQF